MRRAARGEALECDQGPDGYQYLLFELRTHDYVALPAFVLCPRRLRARVRCRWTSGGGAAGPGVWQISGLPWS